jgi:hypothetical protein
MDFNSLVLERYCRKVVPLFVDGVTFLKISVKVIQYPLVTAPQCIQYPMTHYQEVLATL